MQKTSPLRHTPDTGTANGFSLFELSIGLVILSLLAAGALTVGSALIGKQQFSGTQQRVADARQALMDYFNVNGRLPCPARLDLATTDANFATETDCSNTTAPSGTTRIGGGAAYNNAAIRIGALPARTLGLSDIAMSDEYGNRLRYAMSESLALAGNAASAAGAITIIDGNGHLIAQPTSSANSPGAAFVLFSSGPDGKAAYRYQTGSTMSACSGGIDAENCNNDGTFRDARFNNGAGSATFFDDIVTWTPKYLLTGGSTGTAAASPPEGAVQFNHNGFMSGSANFFWDTAHNRVGIGTSTPVASLSVAGGVRARQGIPDAGNNSDRGYAFGADGDTGLFSPGPEADNNDTLAFMTNNSERLRVTNTGNIGIGTEDPASMLQVAGDVLIGRIGTNSTTGDGTGPKLQIGGSTTANSDDIYFQRNNYGANQSRLTLNIGDENDGNDEFTIASGGTNRFTFKNNGTLQVTGNIIGKPSCRQVAGPLKINQSIASCGANEYLMSGGGYCTNPLLGTMNQSYPDLATNSWIIDCSFLTGQGRAIAICCRVE